ncbi:MAG: restriction endonuclease [Candidatus Bathyarchaeota archaeon]|nr:restriction endonuclease [Candidatus Bathyarchaeota archaeon]
MPSRTRGWRTKETRSAKRHRAKRVGGPYAPDYRRGKVHGEVKHRGSKVTKPEVIRIVRREQQRGAERVEIVSTKGFTQPAKEHVSQYYRDRVKLLRK